MPGTLSRSTSAAALIAAVLFFGSCTSDEQSFNSDNAAKASLAEVSAKYVRKQPFTNEDKEKVRAVYEKYPASETVRRAYQNVLIAREDWAVLLELLKSIPESGLTLEDKINLGKVYIKLGRYSEAVEALKDLPAADTPEIASLLGGAYFYLGKYDEAASVLDENWERLVAEKSLDGIVARGLTHFHKGEYEQAVSKLEIATKIDEGSVAANNALSRVYSAMGNKAKAAEYLEKVQASFDDLTAEERSKSRMVGKIYRVREAYNEKEYQEVIDLCRELIPTANPANKAALYEYLYNSYKALGMEKEAADVLKQVRGQNSR